MSNLISDTTIKGLAAVLIPAAVGYFLKYYLDKKQNAGSARTEKKRALYEGYIESVLLFYQKPVPTEKKKKKKWDQDFKEMSDKLQNELVLDASPGVIRAIKKQHDYFRKRLDENMPSWKSDKKITRIFKKMRRDIGTSNWRLGYSGTLLMSPVHLYTYNERIHPVREALGFKMRSAFKRVTTRPRLIKRAVSNRFYRWAYNVKK